MIMKKNPEAHPRRAKILELLAHNGEISVQQLTALYGGLGMGSLLGSSRGTAWGLVNAVTEFVDHHRRARSQDYRLDSAWFGQGAQLKQQALQRAGALLT